MIDFCPAFLGRTSVVNCVAILLVLGALGIHLMNIDTHRD